MFFLCLLSCCMQHISKNLPGENDVKQGIHVKKKIGTDGFNLKKKRNCEILIINRSEKIDFVL